MRVALIKKIDFNFNNLMHSALVSINGSKDKMFVHIQLMNSSVKGFLEVEHIRFSTQDGEIKVEDCKHPSARQLAQIVSCKIQNAWQEEEMSTLQFV